MDESKFLKKVLSVLQKQQVILKKMAQAQQLDVESTKQYLKNAWQTAGLNAGITEMSTPTVNYNPGADVGDPTQLVTVDGSYTISGPIPAKLREKFNQTFYAQIKSQKPELEGKVSAIYNDLPTNNRTV